MKLRVIERVAYNFKTLAANSALYDFMKEREIQIFGENIKIFRFWKKSQQYYIRCTSQT